MYVEYKCVNCGMRGKRSDHPSGKPLPKFCSRLCIGLHKRKPSVIKKRFWSKVEIGGENECWEWKGSIFQGTGYGHFHYYRIPGKQRNVIAHRFAYRIIKGRIPKGLSVCHTCDNTLCCNPRHLWLGTTAANLADMRLKGRSGRGEKQWKSKLRDSDILIIRKMRAGGALQRDIARRFGVSRSLIGLICRKKIWTHI